MAKPDNFGRYFSGSPDRGAGSGLSAPVKGKPFGRTLAIQIGDDLPEKIPVALPEIETIETWLEISLDAIFKRA